MSEGEKSALLILVAIFEGDSLLVVGAGGTAARRSVVEVNVAHRDLIAEDLVLGLDLAFALPEEDCDAHEHDDANEDADQHTAAQELVDFDSS